MFIIFSHLPYRLILQPPSQVKEGVQQLVTLQNPHVAPQAPCKSSESMGIYGLYGDFGCQVQSKTLQLKTSNLWTSHENFSIDERKLPWPDLCGGCCGVKRTNHWSAQVHAWGQGVWFCDCEFAENTKVWHQVKAFDIWELRVPLFDPTLTEIVCLSLQRSQFLADQVRPQLDGRFGPLHTSDIFTVCRKLRSLSSSSRPSQTARPNKIVVLAWLKLTCPPYFHIPWSSNLPCNFQRIPAAKWRITVWRSPGRAAGPVLRPQDGYLNRTISGGCQGLGAARWGCICGV